MILSAMYDPSDWFWIVAGDESRAWSSALHAYVSQWPTGRATRIASETELSDVLRPYGIQGPIIAPTDVDAERSRRLKIFTFNGKAYDFVDGKRSDINISGAGTLALASVMTGVPWDESFVWIAADNSTVSMDAQTCLNFAKTAEDWKARHIYAARAIKSMSPIPADYQSDSRWPS